MLKKFLNNLLGSFSEAEEQEPPYDKYDLDLPTIFNVDNFNKWFKKPKPNSYASEGIIGRVDKLDQAFFIEYFESYEYINNGDVFLNDHFSEYYHFNNAVISNWFKNR